MNKFRWLGAAVSLAALVGCDLPGGELSEARYKLTLHTRVESQDRGVKSDISYEAQLWPDLEGEGRAVGVGTYSGKVIAMKVNCENGEPDYRDELPVEGDLDAEVTELWPGHVNYSLITTDWRLLPLSFGRNHYAQTEEDIEAARGGGSTFDVLGFDLAGDVTELESITESEVASDCGKPTTTTTKLKLERQVLPTHLEAVPFVSTKRWRGEKVTLDGRGSTPDGKIDSYHWELTPGPDCPPETRSMEYEEARVEVTVLCSMQAKLTVTRGSDEHSAEKYVSAAARNWDTDFRQSAHQPLTGYRLRADCEAGACYFGKNVCAYDGVEYPHESGHWFHQDPGVDKIKGWEDVGYTLKQVDDERSPFHGWWYVTDENLEIHRVPLVNEQLYESGPIYKTNKAACEASGTSPCGIDLLLEATRKHETLHGELVKELIAEDPFTDPAQEIEWMFAPPDQYDSLRARVNVRISESEALLNAKALSEDVIKVQMPKRYPHLHREGTVLLPSEPGSSEYTSRYFKTFAD